MFRISTFAAELCVVALKCANQLSVICAEYVQKQTLIVSTLLLLANGTLFLNSTNVNDGTRQQYRYEYAAMCQTMTKHAAAVYNQPVIYVPP